jgi:hypothetical protein
VKLCEALLHHAVQHPLVIQNCDLPNGGEGHVQVAQQNVLPDFGEEDPPPHDNPEVMTREIANMFLHLRAHHQVSHSALNFITTRLAKILPNNVDFDNSFRNYLSSLNAKKKRHTYFV